MKITYVALFSLVLGIASAQTKEQLKDVVKNTNRAELMQMKAVFDAEQVIREQHISAYLQNNPEKSRKFKNGEVEMEIYDVVDGKVSYCMTQNYGSGVTVRSTDLYNGGSLGLNVQGQDMFVNVWDGGDARASHQEFPNEKVFAYDGSGLSAHATHVTGTIAAQGIQENLRGIAFNAAVNSFDWTNDYSEMSTAASDGLLVSNHSYWIGSQLDTWILGAYDNRARSFDQLAFNAPYYLAVTAAGNDRNDLSNSVIGPHIGNKLGYDLIRGMQNAKNYLTVGAVSEVAQYTGAGSVNMSSFSSWGPTDDGRIKPDVVAKGVNVRSTLETSNTANGIMSGTSMASPAVAGVAILLQQHYYNVNEAFMRAATLKGLIMHTADEAGAYEGPDYEFGYGLVNAGKAAQAILDESFDSAVIEELTLGNGEQVTRNITAFGGDPLMVSISWTDRPGAANSGETDSAGQVLINDLDVRILKSGDTYFPWTLDPAEPYNEALNTQDNFRDNYEKIQIDNPAGEYVVVVSHKGASLTGNTQNYSLIITGGQSLSTNDIASSSTVKVFPNPAKDVLRYETKTGVAIKGATVSNLLGQRVAVSLDVNQKILDVAHLQSGIYVVTFEDQNGGVQSIKFVKS